MTLEESIERVEKFIGLMELTECNPQLLEAMKKVLAAVHKPERIRAMIAKFKEKLQYMEREME